MMEWSEESQQVKPASEGSPSNSSLGLIAVTCSGFSQWAGHGSRCGAGTLSVTN